MGKKKKKTPTPLFTAYGPSPGLAELENSCKQSKPSHVTNLGRQRPQHMTQTGTTACTCDLNQPAVNKGVGKSLKKPLQTGPGGLCPLCHVAHLLWQGVPCLLSGIHPDSRILTEGPSELGIVHCKSRDRQHSLKLLC